MTYCLNPSCRDRVNPDSHNFCQACGSGLLLRNRYRVIKAIGGGGFGRTYQAVDQDCLNAPCVVKQFSPSLDIQAEPAVLQKATQMFNQEAVRLFQLGEHPQIPRLLAHFEQDKHLYLVQELIDGQDLKQELVTQGPFNEQKIRQLLAELLPVLQFIHAHGVIHRDIKPENIMRRRQDGKLMLIDFGVSKQATATVMSKAGTMVGTAGYTPMEQMRGRAYPASDLYSLGVTCVCLLTQCLPRLDSSDELYDPLSGRWLWQEMLPDEITVSLTLGQVLDKLLQDLPKDRYQSAKEVLEAIAPTPNISTPTLIPIAPPPDPLISIEIDDSKLQELLAAGRWREADLETVVLMLKLSGRAEERWIDTTSIKKFPCADLRRIDQLWLKYSNDRFGFSVQKQLWESLGGTGDAEYKTWCRFGDRVGWRAQGHWLLYDDLSFNPHALPGHLPAGGPRWSMGGLALLVSTLASKLRDCHSQPK